ncbi:MAG: hypothetical protein LQ338_005991 [Usnochroma carphineum]|nr:MAG: hypothetical protein LQ338_005991 [Usnochroma carphineum]
MTADQLDYTQKPFSVAIVGGGTGGIALAIGLLHRGIHFQVYEAARAHAEIGAGIAFGPNSIQAMQLIDPALKAVFEQLATKNEAPEEEETWINFRNGFDSLDEIAKVRTTDKRKTGLSSVHRAQFLNEIAKLVPPSSISFGKRLTTISTGQHGAFHLLFEDGSMAEADAVIGCDGIRSRVRQLLLDKASPIEDCTFSGKYAFRGLVPMAMAKRVLGDTLAGNSQMYLGPGGSVLTYPINGGETMNVIAFQTEENGKWEASDWVLPNKRDEMLAAFADWHPHVHDILKMMEAPAIWALFDHTPAPCYFRGRVAIAGDAAHASTPHQGAGAGQALEDALVLSELLADDRIQLAHDVPSAFHAYDAVRRPRSQRVVKTSRKAGELYNFQGAEGNTLETIRSNLLGRYRWIWEHDMMDQLDRARSYISRSEALASL